jgi:methylase of polypeptide subunit release factors
LVRRLLEEARGRLAVPGLMLLEIDPRQADAMVALAQQAFADADVSVIKDLAGRERVVRIERGARGNATERVGH